VGVDFEGVEPGVRCRRIGYQIGLALDV
jgi:hypothetical protein